MAFNDWNNNGKKDFTDGYLNYNIYKTSTKNSASASFGGSLIERLLIIFVVFYIFIYLFGDLFEPEKICMEIGCLEECAEDTIYCDEHKR